MSRDINIRRNLIVVSGSLYQPANPFMEWLRYFGSKSGNDGFRCYDIDGCAWDANSNIWTIFEVKGKDEWPKPHQLKTVEVLDTSLRLNPDIVYAGAFIIQVDKHSPADGTTTVQKYDNIKKEWRAVFRYTEDGCVTTKLTEHMLFEFLIELFSYRA